MDCRVSFKKSRNRRLAIDCSECPLRGTLDDPECMKKVLDYLRRSPLDEIQFNRKDYSELYPKEQISMFSEIMDAVRWLDETKVWEEVKCELPEEQERYRKFIHDSIISVFFENPFKAYDILSVVIEQYKTELSDINGDKYKYSLGTHKDRLHEEGVENYLSVLGKIRDSVEKTKLIKAYKEGKTKEVIKPVMQPTFIKSYLDFSVPEGEELMHMYKVAGAEVRIYQKGDEKLYFINPPEMWMYPDQVGLLTKLNEFLNKEHSLEVFDPSDAREYFTRISNEKLPQIAGGITKKDAERLSEIFARYSAGYGLLEILFRDRHILDIYVDSPPGATPVYINHERYGTCTTNLYLLPEDLERLSSKFRAISKRPFDEANPILDMDLKEVGIRVAGLREPSTFDGVAYAFRKHHETPWTLPKLVQKKMLSSRAAAVLSFLIGGQCAMLITGARGSGKTSLLSAILAEIDQRDRIILMEDTAEIPARSLRESGWRIEHLKNQSVIASRRGYELAPEDNLRTALRLGESVLVLGEVRGQEAKVLFEAMRVGAAGNAVLGTIHGSSPYDTWDRITNDLGVPPTSFKAVDVIVSLRYREDEAEKNRVRRVMEVTELRKKWTTNPEAEGAFFDIMKFDEYEGTEGFNVEESEVLKTICKRKGLRPDAFNEFLSVKEKMVDDLVRLSEDYEDLLEIEHIKEANKKFRGFYDKKDLTESYKKWRHWLNEYMGELLSKEDELEDADTIGPSRPPQERQGSA